MKDHLTAESAERAERKERKRENPKGTFSLSELRTLCGEKEFLQ
jgi:hypothetical protein